jgi:hypothetical protein
LASALLLGLMLLAVLGTVAGSIGWVARERATRQLTMETEVNLALKEAERFRGLANTRKPCRQPSERTGCWPMMPRVKTCGIACTG